MEIPVISRISGFENSLQNPSISSRLVGEILQHSIWTWGALILAFLATFSSLTRRTKLLIFRFSKGKQVNSQPLPQNHFESESDDDDDDTCSTSSVSASDDDEDATSDFENRRPYDEETRVAASADNKEAQGQKCKAFSWTDFVNGNSVVKSWDGLGLGFGSSSGNLLSLWDLNELTSSFSGGICQFPAVSMPSPSVIVSAGFENSKNVALKLWDTRAGRQIPELFTELQPHRRKAGKMYVSDDVSPMVVRDIRKLGSLLGGLTESDAKTCWDSDAVIVDSDGELCCLDGSSRNGCGSVVSRCGNAVLSCFNLDKMSNSN